MPSIIQKVDAITADLSAKADKAVKVCDGARACLQVALDTNVDDATLASTAERYVAAHQERRDAERILDAANRAAREALSAERDSRKRAAA